MWKPVEVVKLIKVDEYVFTIESFYDDEFKGDRYSFTVSYPGGHLFYYNSILIMIQQIV